MVVGSVEDQLIRFAEFLHLLGKSECLAARIRAPIRAAVQDEHGHANLLRPGHGVPRNVVLEGELGHHPAA
jgi:hypothetical protein